MALVISLLVASYFLVLPKFGGIGGFMEWVEKIGGLLLHRASGRGLIVIIIVIGIGFETLHEIIGWLGGNRKKPDTLIVTSARVIIVSGVRENVKKCTHTYEAVLELRKKDLKHVEKSIIDGSLTIETTSRFCTKIKPRTFFQRRHRMHTTKKRDLFLLGRL